MLGTRRKGVRRKNEDRYSATKRERKKEKNVIGKKGEKKEDKWTKHEKLAHITLNFNIERKK